jgi:ATP-dependent Lhr-like helicase
LVKRLRAIGTPALQLEKALPSLLGLKLPADAWESSVFPLRVNGYKASLLDSVLAAGVVYWQLDKDGELCFRSYPKSSWEEPAQPSLGDDELTAYMTLKKRGATFAQVIAPLLKGSPYDALMGLAEKELAHADSFVPVRQLSNAKKADKGTTRQDEKRGAKLRARSRVAGTCSGRWELSPTLTPTIEDELEAAFDRAVVLCRETASGIPWTQALPVLRRWEFAGRVRRGYFVDGLSGAQFIRSSDYEAATAALQYPFEEAAWIPATDPAQPWGKALPHLPGRAFQNVSGSLVCLKKGVPAAVFERQGKTLRCFDNGQLPEALSVFAKDYMRRRVFLSQSRIVVRDYPAEAEPHLLSSGFSKVMDDYVIYQGYI